MKSKQKDYNLFVLMIWLILVVGWVMNLYKVFTVDWEEPFKTEAIRTISAFIAPVGGVIGYMHIGEENVND